MLFALPGYQFPYTIINRCLYLTLVYIEGQRKEGREKGGSVDKERGSSLRHRFAIPNSPSPHPISSPLLSLPPRTTIHTCLDRQGKETKGKERRNSNSSQTRNTQSSSDGGIRWPATERVPGGVMAGPVLPQGHRDSSVGLPPISTADCDDVGVREDQSIHGGAEADGLLHLAARQGHSGLR
jgi:hypothetical protein